MTGISAVSLDCETGVIILGVIAGIYTVVSLVLLGFIIWCACCYGKRKFQVRPLSPKSGYRSPKNSVSYPEDLEMVQAPISAQREARRLRESALASRKDRVVVASIVYKNSPFISRHEDQANDTNKQRSVDSYPAWRNSRESPLLHKQMVWEENTKKEHLNSTNTDSGKGSMSGGGCHSDEHSSHGDSPSSRSNGDSDNVFVNNYSHTSLSDDEVLNTEIHDLSQSPSNHDGRKRDALIHRRKRARRTDSTKPLIGASESSDISEHVLDDRGSYVTPPSSQASTPSTPIRVLTRHAGSRKKKRADSLGDEDRSNHMGTWPRANRLPPIAVPPTVISNNRPLSPIPSPTERTPDPASIERPRPRGQRSQSPSRRESTLPRLSLNLTEDLGLNDDEYRTAL